VVRGDGEVSGVIESYLAATAHKEET
jgi:hypothetical protein